MNLSLEQINASIENLEAILPQLENASTEKHKDSDAGWWITMAGALAGTALAVDAGNEARKLDRMISIVENKLILLRTAKISLFSQPSSN